YVSRKRILVRAQRSVQRKELLCRRERQAEEESIRGHHWRTNRKEQGILLLWLSRDERPPVPVSHQCHRADAGDDQWRFLQVRLSSLPRQQHHLTVTVCQQCGPRQCIESRRHQYGQAATGAC